VADGLLRVALPLKSGAAGKFMLTAFDAPLGSSGANGNFISRKRVNPAMKSLKGLL
jgi:hypothetical protein